MTKSELRTKLIKGKTLDELLRFIDGQEATIFKATTFAEGKDIIYIPDVGLNDICIYKVYTDRSEIEEVLSYCYTGDDFIEECNGNRDMAEMLFHYVDWQHPSSALPELMDDDDELEQKERPVSISGVLIDPERGSVTTTPC